MKKLLCAIAAAAMLSGCAAPAVQTTQPPESVSADSGAVQWQLEKGGLKISAPDGMAENAITTEKTNQHTIVRINAPGTYVLSGKLAAGQIAVDLGAEAKDDPSAVVTLILDNADITCTAAPAVIFYNVYECGDAENPAAGANVILAEGSANRVIGAHTEEYDGAFYSRMSMNISGAGQLSIEGDNEGLCSERHLTIHSGDIAIRSGNDGINTNEDGVSVTTINGGSVSIQVTGETGEGDGIDSNGWIIINGGSVQAFACGSSADSGLDADMGIRLGGGTVIATGNMLDQIEADSQTHAVFSFSEPQTGGSYALKNEGKTALFDIAPPNTFTHLLYCAPALTEATYTLWSDDLQLEGVTGGRLEPMKPIDRPDFPDRSDGYVEIPPQPTTPIVTHGTVQPSQGTQPENMPVPSMPEGGGNMPVPPGRPGEGSENMPMPQLPGGVMPPQDGSGKQPIQIVTGTVSTDFPITQGANYFSNVRAAE